MTMATVMAVVVSVCLHAAPTNCMDITRYVETPTQPRETVCHYLVRDELARWAPQHRVWQVRGWHCSPVYDG